MPILQVAPALPMNTPRTIALIAVTRKGVHDACRLRERLRIGDLYRPAHHGPVQHSWEHGFDGALPEQVAALFRRYEQLVFFLAAGAVLRLIPPSSASKGIVPGVWVLEGAGQFVFPFF